MSKVFASGAQWKAAPDLAGEGRGAGKQLAGAGRSDRRRGARSPERAGTFAAIRLHPCLRLTEGQLWLLLRAGLRAERRGVSGRAHAPTACAGARRCAQRQ